MSSEFPTLHMMCGKIAAGKSTFAAQLAGPKGTVLITEDSWLDGLFADQMATPRDYLRCTGKLRAVMGPHVAALLDAGVSVVLDFAANTLDQRAWMRGILEATGAAHELHLLAPPDEVCLDRLRRRNASGAHPFVVTDEQFHQFSRHFMPPGPEEGFNVVRHDS